MPPPLVKFTLMTVRRAPLSTLRMEKPEEPPSRMAPLVPTMVRLVVMLGSGSVSR